MSLTGLERLHAATVRVKMPVQIFQWCARQWPFVILALGVPLAGSTNAVPPKAQAAVQTPSAPSSLMALGQELFNDTRLSSDGTVSCASCHIPAKNFSDGRRVAIGVGGRAGTRNTPSLSSSSLSAGSTFFWDGRRNRLDQAVMDPFTNPVEMGLDDPRILLDKMGQIPVYRNYFKDAAPRDGGSQELAEIALALSAYVQSVDRPISPFDRYASGRDPTALSAQSQRGLAIFSNKGRCSQCHLLNGTSALTDHTFHRTGVGFSDVQYDLPKLTSGVIERSLHGAVLGNRVATHAEEAQLGRFNVTHEVSDIAKFRTPSLRGVALTAPYMHDGSVKTLGEAIDREVYYRSLDSGRPVGLTIEERNDLLAFLKTL
ncbi:cytochrome-c peroxidase [Rhodanobacter umsongensis]|uniref:Cytochrome-c peroxidase n=1 Tax=Rhodanobacter umsongensis TaxID=633153 RepID=A0ABW0JJS8_9GAMM